MRRIGIIDADLIGRKKHRFPNLVSMKWSAYHKAQGDDVELLLDYDNVEEFDKIYLSKVFTDTEVPSWVLTMDTVEYGGTGFFFDKAPDLPYEVEHTMPDYSLYDKFLEGKTGVEYKFYRDYSIGFLTRGCFRKCGFCVNKKYDRAFVHSALDEFYDPSRKKICLLDDNFFSHPKWKELLEELRSTGKPFQFKQGLDERLLTDEKCELLFSSKYDGDITFAFDDVEDYKMIEKKLKTIRKHTCKQLRFYVLCGYDKEEKYDEAFWKKDLVDTFVRIELLREYGCYPYIMRFIRYEESPYRGIYINLARWCNQPSMFKKKSFHEFCNMDCHIGLACQRYYDEFVAANDFLEERHLFEKWRERE